MILYSLIVLRNFVIFDIVVTFIVHIVIIVDFFIAIVISINYIVAMPMALLNVCERRLGSGHGGEGGKVVVVLIVIDMACSCC